MYKIDKKDKLILKQLQKDCKQSTRELGKKLKMPATTIHQRIRKLINRGIIKNFSAILDPEKIELSTTAIVLVKRSSYRRGKVSHEHIGDVLAKIPEIEEVYLVTGEYDAVLKIRGKTEREIGKWVVDKLWNIPEVERTLTFFVFHKSKESNIFNLK